MIKRVLILLLVTSQYLLAIVIIAPVEIGSQAGFSGKISASLETKRGITDKDSYKASSRVAYDNNSSYVIWAEVSGAYAEVNDVENTRKLYFHLRHIQAITSKSIRMELFAQAQEDKFKLIEYRRLGGVGLRIKLFDNINSYLGLGGFHEGIRYTSQNDPKESNVRVNTYLTFSTQLTDDSKLSYTLYYQPKYDEIDDYIELHKFNLQLRVYKSLFLNLRASYDKDTHPALGLVKENLYQETSFLLKF